MAKGKGKGRTGSSGPRKSHGPKKHLFKEYKPMIRDFASLGLLTKYNNYESWQLAMAARGKKNVSRSDFNQFVILSMEEKKKYFQNLKK